MWLKFPAGAPPFKVGRELGVWCLVTSFQERTKVVKLSCRSVIQLLRVIVFTQRKINLNFKALRKINLLLFNELQKFFFPELTSRPARRRTLLDFINRPILKGVAPAGNLKRVFTGKLSQNRKKILGELCMRHKLFKTAKTLQAI